jgi:two-component system chemotaxis sensor kinase CheA
MPEEQAQSLDDQAAIDLIFRAGFSTRTTATEVSGRGVGMDVVRQHLDQLGGQIAISSAPGAGTRFSIHVPLTLATMRAILVEQNGQLFAVPSKPIERTARVKEPKLLHLQGRMVVAVDGHPVPAVELADVLERPRSAGSDPEAAQSRPFFVLRSDDARAALLVDQLVGEQEIVVKQLAWPLRRVRNVAGATILGTGQTVAILNPTDLMRTALKLVGASGKRVQAEKEQAPATARPRSVLVVDDSLPTRTLERSILDVAGYQTFVAADGNEALKLLRTELIDLVVSDVQMPGLDGFGLTTEIRRDEQLRHIPVILVTSMATTDYRERGVQVGADAYIVKGQFEQGQLLDTVGRLIA